MGSGAKSYMYSMRKGFLILYKRRSANVSPFMRRPLVMYDFAPDPSEFPYTVYEENYILFFISVTLRRNRTVKLID